MRFYLDNDVDHRCRDVILRNGHECWTTSEAGRGRAGDDEQTHYASEKRAIIITHDREYTERRKRNTIDRHVRLCCEQPDGPRFLENHLEEACAILGHRSDVVVEIRYDGVFVFSGWR